MVAGSTALWVIYGLCCALVHPLAEVSHTGLPPPGKGLVENSENLSDRKSRACCDGGG